MLNLSSCICVTNAAATSSWWCYTPVPTEGELLTMDLLSTSMFIQQQCLALPNVHKGGLRSQGAQHKKPLQGISNFEKTCSFHSCCILTGETLTGIIIYIWLYHIYIWCVCIYICTYTYAYQFYIYVAHVHSSEYWITDLIATEFLGWRVSLVSSAQSLNPKLLQSRKVT